MMNDIDPIELLFGGMDKLGPGDDADTLKALSMIPSSDYRTVVDAGCGTGRQTLTLARELQCPIHAIDLHQPFLTHLSTRARNAGLDSLIELHGMSIEDIPERFSNVDLIWSEGSAYNIGFKHALSTWRRALGPKGCLVVSELSWTKADVPSDARQFFESAYPAMQSAGENATICREVGYELLDTHVVSQESWVNGYYDVLKPKAQDLIDHPESSVRDLAREMLDEIRVFETSGESYGYVFFVLQPTSGP